MKKEEIFEEPKEELEEIDKKVKGRKGKKVKVVEEEIEEPKPIEKKVKAKKPRKAVSPNTKARLLQNLAKGRATSLANRQRKAKLKAIEKSKKLKDEEEIILKDLQAKKESLRDKDDLKREIEELRKQLAQKKEEPVEEKVKPIKKKKKKIIIEEESEDEGVESEEEEEEVIVKKVKRKKEKKVVEERAPTPVPVIVPELPAGFAGSRFSNKELVKLMKNFR